MILMGAKNYKLQKALFSAPEESLKILDEYKKYEQKNLNVMFKWWFIVLLLAVGSGLAGGVIMLRSFLYQLCLMSK